MKSELTNAASNFGLDLTINGTISEKGWGFPTTKTVSEQRKMEYKTLRIIEKSIDGTKTDSWTKESKLDSHRWNT